MSSPATPSTGCACKTVAVPDDVRLLSAREAADALGIATRTISRLVAQGRLRPVRISARAVRYRLSDLRAFVDSAQKARTP